MSNENLKKFCNTILSPTFLYWTKSFTAKLSYQKDSVAEVAGLAKQTLEF